MSVINTRGKINKQWVNQLRLSSSQIFCDECGAVYDTRTGEGLCASCEDEEASPPRVEQPPSR